jgi:hypothetical protein
MSGWWTRRARGIVRSVYVGEVLWVYRTLDFARMTRVRVLPTFETSKSLAFCALIVSPSLITHTRGEYQVKLMEEISVSPSLVWRPKYFAISQA